MSLDPDVPLIFGLTCITSKISPALRSNIKLGPSSVFRLLLLKAMLSLGLSLLGTSLFKVLAISSYTSMIAPSLILQQSCFATTKEITKPVSHSMDVALVISKEEVLSLRNLCLIHHLSPEHSGMLVFTTHASNVVAKGVSDISGFTAHSSLMQERELREEIRRFTLMLISPTKWKTIFTIATVRMFQRCMSQQLPVVTLAHPISASNIICWQMNDWRERTALHWTASRRLTFTVLYHKFSRQRRSVLTSDTSKSVRIHTTDNWLLTFGTSSIRVFSSTVYIIHTTFLSSGAKKKRTEFDMKHVSIPDVRCHFYASQIRAFLC